MKLAYILIIIYSLGNGIYNLSGMPVYAMQYLLMGLYFFLSFHQLQGNSFRKEVYLMMAVLFVVSGGLNIMVDSNVISILICFFFAYSSFEIYRRMRQGIL